MAYVEMASEEGSMASNNFNTFKSIKLAMSAFVMVHIRLGTQGCVRGNERLQIDPTCIKGCWRRVE